MSWVIAEVPVKSLNVTVEDVEDSLKVSELDGVPLRVTL